MHIYIAATCSTRPAIFSFRFNFSHFLLSQIPRLSHLPLTFLYHHPFPHLPPFISHLSFRLSTPHLRGADWEYIFLYTKLSSVIKNKYNFVLQNYVIHTMYLLYNNFISVETKYINLFIIFQLLLS